MGILWTIREFIILYRKIIMVFISVFMVTYGVAIQVNHLSYDLFLRHYVYWESHSQAIFYRCIVNHSKTRILIIWKRGLLLMQQLPCIVGFTSFQVRLNKWSLMILRRIIYYCGMAFLASHICCKLLFLLVLVQEPVPGVQKAIHRAKEEEGTC